jgi:pimeloyl-ACP methyl ester carboxylesterase
VPHEEHSFFADLYETYRHRYEQMFSADFSPVQDLATRLTAPVQSLVSEGLHTAESSAHHVYESLVPTRVDESLAAVRHATYVQLTEAWNSVKNIRERLETARFLSQKRQALQQQLRGYRVMLHRMLENSHAAARMPSQQKAILMRRITECNEALEGLEKRAQSAFVQATGFARKNLAQLLPSREEPRRFATYSSDPLLGTATYPLGLHVLVLGGTEIPLRILMARRGFEKKRIGPVSYYYHPGTASPVDALDDALMQDDLSNSNHGVDDDPVPLVFVHGIGIGLIAYLPLVDALLKTGRPLFLPEIPYVSGFRPWQSPNAVLSPQVVTSTLSAMLASHGFLRATFAGHSYGTSWLSYMCKYAEDSVAALLFLDPICFCLHHPHLTKSFVYFRPDPGTMAYIVRTDVIVNWTIQRSFPWAWISLFTEQIKVPTTIFLSEKDMLVPAEKVEAYLVERQVPVCDYNKVTADYFESEAVVNACVFRGDGHGGWTERPGQTVPLIATAAEILCQRAIRKN